jgi:diacylglycerol kinase family enzyme
MLPHLLESICGCCQSGKHDIQYSTFNGPLQHPRSMKVVLIHNPAAGVEDQPSADDMANWIRAAGHSVIYRSSNHADWKNLLQESADLIAVAGGDGIVGKVAKLSLGKNMPIAVLPMGTANNIAGALGLTDKSLKELIATWSRARPTRFDVGVARGPWGENYFLEGIGVGLFADTMSRLDARKNVDLAHLDAAEEKITSVLEIMHIRLESCPLHDLKVALDGRDLSGEYILVEAMNIRSVGPNLVLAPHAQPGDGLLDIVLITKADEAELSEYLSRRIGKGAGGHGLTGCRARHLRIECANSRVHIDDDIWPEKDAPPPAAIDISLADQSLEMLVPD